MPTVRVTSLRVRSFDLDHLDIFWEIAPVIGPKRDEDPHTIFDYDFYVLRSGDSPLGMAGSSTSQASQS